MEYPQEFEEFWAAFPKRMGDNPKSGAFTKWKTATTTYRIAPVDLISAAKLYYNTMYEKIGTPMIPMCQTWLHQRRWEQLEHPPEKSDKPIAPKELTGWRLEAWEKMGDTLYQAWVAPTVVTKNDDTVTIKYKLAFKVDFARNHYGIDLERIIKKSDPSIARVVFAHG